ncbi:MAG: DUF1667 domain-containing protein [Treponema sp.]|nr:DUF1667 domain-containing protein [Treponema sp.]
MRNLTCIVCPIGCALEVKENTSRGDMFVTGNKCPKGESYAIEELTAPKRTVTATVPLKTACSIRRIPVKTSSPCPKEKISALLQDIYKTQISLPVKIGDIIIENWNGEGFNVITTRTIS